MGKKVNEIVTDKIIEQLEKGTVSWRKPFFGRVPMNYTTKKPYRGLNVLLLWGNDYELPYYLSFKQARKLGGCVRKGEKGHVITFWKRFETDELDSRGRTKFAAVLRYYTVFNVAQCDGIKIKPEEIKGSLDFNPIIKCEKIIEDINPKPDIKHSAEGRAYYSPNGDYIHCPNKGQFKSVEEYYSTLFHEIVHWTGHDSRLKRKGVTESHMFGDHIYSEEELIAEIGASFIMANIGINNTFENSTAYISHWLDKLKRDSNIIIRCAGKAQKAYDYIMGQSYEPEPED